MLLGVLLHPLGGDLAVVVVGRDRVDFLAELLERERNQLVHVLRRRGAGAEAVAVAHASLVLGVVEVERVEPLEHRPDGFTRGGRDAGVDDGHALLGGRLGGELRVQLDIGLGVIADELDLTSRQSAGAVDLFDASQRVRGECDRKHE